MIAVGSQAPEFKLDSQFDTEFTLSQFKGTKNVMLVFLSEGLDFHLKQRNTWH